MPRAQSPAPSAKASSGGAAADDKTPLLGAIGVLVLLLAYTSSSLSSSNATLTKLRADSAATLRAEEVDAAAAQRQRNAWAAGATSGALRLAAAAGDADRVGALLSVARVHPDAAAEQEYGQTPLMAAASCGCVEDGRCGPEQCATVVKALVAGGAALERRNDAGATALMQVGAMLLLLLLLLL